ncbi:MAG TPA: GspE/PulE family protein [Phycisphaerae bacterium]|nr:GspE/PulE family protein [Phycisphaerae bacterium]
MALSTCDELRGQLLAGKILPPAQIEQLEQVARDGGFDLETAIRKNRVLTETNLQALRAMRLEATYCNVSEFLPRLSNSELIPEELARRHLMFPMFVLDGVITLAMENPGDLAGIDQVRRQTRQEVEVCAGSRSEILGLIERAYGASKYLEQSSVADSLLEAAEAVGGDETQPVIRLVDELINEAVRQGASDIHIEPGERELRIRIRVDGVLREVAAPPLGLHKALVSRVKVISKLDISKTRSPQDGAYHHRNGETEVMLRISVLPSVFGEALVMRILRNASESITLSELGMREAMLQRFHAVITNAHGMILVSGPTGSGKSTTLYAAIKCIVSPQKNIIAIEDPVEYRTSAIRQVQVNTEANLTFAGGLRSILRQDPDVIMVGEIRDKETAQIAVQAALTGHLLLSTVHTNDSIGAIARMRDLGVAEYLISSSLLAVLAQRLCRKICPDCQEPDAPPEFLLRAVGLEPGKLDFQPMRGKGCRRCVGAGYVGRVGLFELFELTEQFGAMIVKMEPMEVIRAAAREAGMKFLVNDGVEKIRAGLTTVEEVARVAGRA